MQSRYRLFRLSRWYHLFHSYHLFLQVPEVLSLGDTLDWIVENEAGVDGRTPSRRGAEPVTSVAASR